MNIAQEPRDEFMQFNLIKGRLRAFWAKNDDFSYSNELGSLKAQTAAESLLNPIKKRWPAMVNRSSQHSFSCFPLGLQVLEAFTPVVLVVVRREIPYYGTR